MLQYVPSKASLCSGNVTQQKLPLFLRNYDLVKEIITFYLEKCKNFDRNPVMQSYACSEESISRFACAKSTMLEYCGWFPGCCYAVAEVFWVFARWLITGLNQELTSILVSRYDSEVLRSMHILPFHSYSKV